MTPLRAFNVGLWHLLVGQTLKKLYSFYVLDVFVIDRCLTFAWQIITEVDIRRGTIPSGIVVCVFAKGEIAWWEISLSRDKVARTKNYFLSKQRVSSGYNPL